MGHKHSNDLGLYMDGLDKILEELEEAATEDPVTKVVVPQLREASRAQAYPSLAVDFESFDRAAPGSAERSVEFLYTCVRQCLLRNGREAMRSSPAKLSQAPSVLPGGSSDKTPCYAWIRGKFKHGATCKFEHDPKAAPKSGKGGAADPHPATGDEKGGKGTTKR